MRLSEDHLLGWLCVMRLNLGEGEAAFCIPDVVRDQLPARGWCTISAPDDVGCQEMHVTDAGATASDLAAPEWGVDPIAAASDVSSDSDMTEFGGL